ncbi:hypothetical protein Tco_0631141 [Tanacetum coccineum]
MDSGSSCEVIYEHCSMKLKSSIRASKVDSKVPLIGFSGEKSWSIGKIPLEITIGDAPLTRKETLNFVIVKSGSLCYWGGHQCRIWDSWFPPFTGPSISTPPNGLVLYSRHTNPIRAREVLQLNQMCVSRDAFPSLVLPLVYLSLSLVSLSFRARTYNLSTLPFRDSVQIWKIPENNLDVLKFPENNLEVLTIQKKNLYGA